MTISNSEIHQMISAQEAQLRQSISRAVNSLADLNITQQRLGRFGWIAKTYTHRTTSRLRRQIKKGKSLLAFNREIRDLLNLVERATP